MAKDDKILTKAIVLKRAEKLLDEVLDENDSRYEMERKAEKAMSEEFQRYPV